MEWSIILSVVALICASVFIGIGIGLIVKKETPIDFCPETEIKKEKISELRMDKRTNGIVWVMLGCVFILAGILGLVFRMQ